MGRRLTILMTIIVLFVGSIIGAGTPARAAAITVCRDTSVAWLRYRFSGIDWNADTFHYVALGASQQGNTLIADALLEDNGDGLVFAGEAFVAYYIADNKWFTLKGTPSTAPCGSDKGWHPGASSIAVSLVSDCAYVEIQDAYGHWSRVSDTTHPDGILLHYGDSLIGGPGQSTDPDDYRAVATACF